MYFGDEKLIFGYCLKVLCKGDFGLSSVILMKTFQNLFRKFSEVFLKTSSQI